MAHAKHKPILLFARKEGEAARSLGRLFLWGVEASSVTVTQDRQTAVDWMEEGRGLVLYGQDQVTQFVEEMIHSRIESNELERKALADSVKQIKGDVRWMVKILVAGVFTSAAAAGAAAWLGQ